MIRLTPLAVLAAGLLACNDTGRIDVSVATSPLAAESVGGTTATLVVTVNALRVHVGDDDDDSAPVVNDAGVAEDDDAAGGGWHTVFTGAAQLDLADADATALFLGTAEVPAGKITQIRLVLDGAPVYTTADGAAHDVTCPSCTTSGLKIVTRGLVLEGGDHLALDLVFDPATELSLTPTGYRMMPVVKLDEVRPVDDESP
jgi:hypothetical protein